jgi:molybdate transport system substrate-binding protein
MSVRAGIRSSAGEMPKVAPTFDHKRDAVQRRTFLAASAAFSLARLASAEAKPVLVFAAASLKNALDKIAADWRSEAGKQATVSYAASSTLAKQIENAAPANLFISADEDWMDYLQRRNLLDSKTRIDLLGNALVLIAPKDGRIETTVIPGFPLARLLSGGRLAMADPNAVPAGKYAKAALTALGVWPSVAGQIAAAENVRAALLLVARGEAPLGIVYKTDAAAEPGVAIVAAFPPDTHPPIVYPMALVAGSTNPDAPALATYLRGPAARAQFEAQGFTVLAAPS